MTLTQPSGDNDLTVILPHTQTDPSTHAPNTHQHNDNVLPVGATLGEFEIVDIIGWGGFGIVYLAYDHSLQRQVALKEYMPSNLAVRNNEGIITLRSDNHKETFQAGLRSFINEARLLAHFDHPSLVKVYRFWESNGTAYMVMPHYQGVTLKEKMRDRDQTFDEKSLKNLLFHLLDALKVLHTDQCYHRDISPDNILILEDDTPILLDFGAARRVITDMTQSLTVILKPGYAPIEQYSDEVTITQGPWTDIYALAAVVYFVITGKAPIPSVSRLVADKLIPLSKSAVHQYSIDFLRGIDTALSVKPENRPRNVDEFRKLLGITPQQSKSVNSSASPIQADSPRNKRPIILSAIVATALFVIIGLNIAPSPENSTSETSNSQVNSASISLDPIHALEMIFNARNRDHTVNVSIEKAQVIINKGQLHFKIRSSKPGYIYILAVGTNNLDFILFFPNAKDQNNRIAANQQIELPRKEWEMIAGGPPGTNHFIAIVSDEPRDFSKTGLQTNGIFGTFSSNQTTELYRSYKGSAPFFAGEIICVSDPTKICSESYGAVLFSIEEIKI